MTTCTVTDTIADARLEPVAGARLTFTPEPQEVAAVDGATGVPGPITVTSGPDGAVAVELVPGVYRLRVQARDGAHEASVTVPEAEAAILADLLTG